MLKSLWLEGGSRGDGSNVIFLPYCSALFHSGVGDSEAFVNFCKPSLRDLVVLASSKVREAQGAGRLECSRRTGLLLQVKSLRAAHSHQ